MLLGKTLPLKIAVPSDKGLPYVLAASLQVGNILLPRDVLIPLVPDLVFDLSLVPNNGVFFGFRGSLDVAGRGAGSLVVPNLSAARGVKLYFSGITATSSGMFRTVMPWVRVLVK